MEEVPEEEKTLATVSFISITLSVVLSTILILFSTVCILLKLKYSDRLSFRLSIWIAIVDAVYGFITYKDMRTYKSILLLTIANSIGFYSNLVFVFLSCAMAFNLKTVFVDGIISKRFSERFYVTSSFGGAFLIIFPYTTTLLFNKNYSLANIVKRPLAYSISWLNFYIYQSAGVLYCIISVFQVVLKLLKTKKEIDKNKNNSDNHAIMLESRVCTKIEKTVRRIIWYPLILIITQLPFIIVSNIYYLQPDNPKSMFEKYLHSTPGYLTGFLNSIVFLFDPALSELTIQLKLLMYYKLGISTKSKHDCLQTKSSETALFHALPKSDITNDKNISININSHLVNNDKTCSEVISRKNHDEHNKENYMCPDSLL